MTLYFILGFFGISLLGCVLHFTFDWFNHNKYLASFMAINESTFEHIKIAQVPMLIWAFVGMLLFDFTNFAFAIFIGLLVIPACIILLFYTYTFFTKKPILAVDISIFFVSIAVSLLVVYAIITSAPLAPVFNIIGLVGIGLVIASLPLFTFFPPKCILFKDPISGKYGFEGHSDCLIHKH